MKAEEFKIEFQPSGRVVYALAGTSLLEAAARAGIVLQTPCGGTGRCGKCRVQVTTGFEHVARGTTGLEGQANADPGTCLACVARIQGPMTVLIPASSLFESRHQILTHDTGVRAALDPHVRRCPFALPPPASSDARSDVSRLQAALPPGTVVPSALFAMLPAWLRGHAWQGTALLREATVMTLEASSAPAPHGLALDIGTTTVVATLMDLASGMERGVAAAVNGQAPLGDDVVSRIQRVREKPSELTVLQNAVRDTVNTLIQGLTHQANIDPHTLVDVTVAGNTAMQQLLCGYDPSALGELPFVPVFERGHARSAHALGLNTHPEAQVFVFPQIGGFVGGDTVAAMLAARLGQDEKPVLLVDIGTNGEIVLAAHGRLLATSVAAGPAFEGARIAQGMRAVPGAIEKVVMDDDGLQINVIGNVTPVGLCGSALIDAAAALLNQEMMDETGRLLVGEALPHPVSAVLHARLREENGEPCFVLADHDEVAPGAAPVALTQKDIRELQLATAAVRAGINMLLRREGLEPDAIGTVLLAGGFGNFIRRRHAQRIGLLPALPHERIVFMGNAASLGAKLALLSVAERRTADQLRDQTEHVDLSRDPEFQNEFGAAMLFPDPACS